MRLAAAHYNPLSLAQLGRVEDVLHVIGIGTALVGVAGTKLKKRAGKGEPFADGLRGVGMFFHGGGGTVGILLDKKTTPHHIFSHICFLYGYLCFFCR
jgi:hypothetical protein